MTHLHNLILGIAILLAHTTCSAIFDKGEKTEILSDSGGMDAPGDASVVLADSGGIDASSDASAGLTCDAIFGSAEEYLACPAHQSDGECAFNVKLNSSTCDALCGTFGRTCIRAINNPDRSCTSLGDKDCFFQATDAICVCSMST